jgi:hypothetical protein
MIGQDNYISINISKAEDESRKRKFPASSDRKSPVEVEAPTSDGLYVPSASRKARWVEGDPRDGVVHQRNSSPYAAPLFRAGTNIGNIIEGKFIRTVLRTPSVTVSSSRDRYQSQLSS